MTLNEIAYNLLNLVRGGRSSHDEHISLDQIKFNVKHYRAMFIRRDYSKNVIATKTALLSAIEPATSLEVTAVVPATNILPICPKP